MQLSDIVDNGVYVNVDGNAGELTVDPATGQLVVAVNSQGTAGKLGTPTPQNPTGLFNTNPLANLSPSSMFIGIIILFGLAVYAIGKRA